MSVTNDRILIEKLVAKYGAKDVDRFIDEYSKTEKIDEGIIDDIKSKIASRRYNKAKERFYDNMDEEGRQMAKEMAQNTKRMICGEVYRHNGIAGFQLPDVQSIAELSDMYESGNFTKTPVYFIDADVSRCLFNGFLV